MATTLYRTRFLHSLSRLTNRAQTFASSSVKAFAVGSLIMGVAVYGYYEYQRVGQEIEVAKVVVDGVDGDEQLAEELLDDDDLLLAFYEKVSVPDSNWGASSPPAPDTHVVGPNIHITPEIVEQTEFRKINFRFRELFANKVLNRVRCKLGSLPYDALHQRIVHREANSICVKMGLRSSHRLVVVKYVASLYFVESELDREVARASRAYARSRYSFWRTLRARILGW